MAAAVVALVYGCASAPVTRDPGQYAPLPEDTNLTPLPEAQQATPAPTAKTETAKTSARSEPATNNKPAQETPVVQVAVVRTKEMIEAEVRGQWVGKVGVADATLAEAQRNEARARTVADSIKLHRPARPSGVVTANVVEEVLALEEQWKKDLASAESAAQIAKSQASQALLQRDKILAEREAAVAKAVEAATRPATTLAMTGPAAETAQGHAPEARSTQSASEPAIAAPKPMEKTKAPVLAPMTRTTPSATPPAPGPQSERTPTPPQPRTNEETTANTAAAILAKPAVTAADTTTKAAARRPPRAPVKRKK